MSKDRSTPARGQGEPVKFRSANERIEQLASDPLIAADVERYSDERVAWSAQQDQ
jgi:hypothetical protein